MPDYLIDLLSWTAFFIAFFIVLRWFQNRKKNKRDDDT